VRVGWIKILIRMLGVYCGVQGGGVAPEVWKTGGGSVSHRGQGPEQG
jgi:hypothetical protein